MNAKKIKDTLQRLSGEYENLIKSTMCIRCLEETEAERTSSPMVLAGVEAEETEL